MRNDEVGRAWPAAVVDPHVTEQNQVEIQRARCEGHGPFASSLELDFEQRVENIACRPIRLPDGGLIEVPRLRTWHPEWLGLEDR